MLRLTVCLLLTVSATGCGIPVRWLPKHGDPTYVDTCAAGATDRKKCGNQPPRDVAEPDKRTPADTVKSAA